MPAKIHSDEMIYNLYMGNVTDVKFVIQSGSIIALARKLEMGEFAVKDAITRYCKQHGKFLVTNHEWRRGRNFAGFSESQIVAIYKETFLLEATYQRLGERIPIKEIRGILNDWAKRGNFLVKGPDWEELLPKPLNVAHFLECCKTKPMETVCKIFGKTENEVTNLVRHYQFAGIKVEVPKPAPKVQSAKYPKYNPGANHGSGNRLYDSKNARPSRKEKRIRRQQDKARGRVLSEIQRS